MAEKEYAVAKVSGKIYKNAIYQKLLPSSTTKKPEKKTPEIDLSDVDEIDLRIIKLLVKDSRTTLSAMAGELGIGTSTVYKRLSRLVDDGVIKKFTILTDGQRLGIAAAAYVGIRCAKNAKEAVKTSLLEIQDVVEIHEVLEPYDLLVKVRSSDVQSLKEGPLNILSGLEGIEDLKPILVVNTIKEVLYNL